MEKVLGTSMLLVELRDEVEVLALQTHPAEHAWFPCDAAHFYSYKGGALVNISIIKT